MAEAKRHGTEVVLDWLGEDQMDLRQGRGEVTREGPHCAGKGRRAHPSTMDAVGAVVAVELLRP